LLKNNNKTLKLLKFVFDQKSAASLKVPPRASGTQPPPPCYAPASQQKLRRHDVLPLSEVLWQQSRKTASKIFGLNNWGMLL